MSNDAGMSPTGHTEPSPGSSTSGNAQDSIPETGERCPTPLAWKQVRTEFLAQSDPFEFRKSDLTIRGRVFGEGTPLYFLNGISATSTLFCLTAWLLRDEFRCVILDYPPEATRPDQLASILDLTADELQDEYFDLYATSFGAAIALEAMARPQPRINRVVLQGPVLETRFSLAEKLAFSLLKWHRGRMEQLPFRRTVLQNNHGRWFPPFDITRWQFLMQETGSVRTQEVVRRARMLGRLDLTDRLADIRTPTLIISSEGEAIRHREAAKLLANTLPEARAEEISNTGHVPFVTHPHRLVKLIRQFLHSEGHTNSGKVTATADPAR